MKLDILKFEVRLYSPDGVNSPITDYLYDLSRKNIDLTKQAIKDLYSLPQHFYLFTNIKHFRHGSKKFYELRVRHKSDICRFFFTVVNPNFIVVYGFTKKTQKTEKQDVQKCVDYLDSFNKNSGSIALENIGSLI